MSDGNETKGRNGKGSKEAILGVKLEREKVEAFGTTVTVQEMSGATFEQFAEHHDSTEKDACRLASIVAFSVIDSWTGDLEFTPADIPALSKLSYRELAKVTEAANRLSNLRGDQGN